MSVSINETANASRGAKAETSMVKSVSRPSSSQTRTMIPRPPSSAGLIAVTTTLSTSSETKDAVGSRNEPGWFLASGMTRSGF